MAEVAASSPGPRVFTPRTVLLIVLVGVFSFLALLMAGTYAPDMQAKNDPGAHALSKSAVGYAGLVELLHDLGRQAIVARGPVPTGNPSIMVLTIDHGDPNTPLRGLPTTAHYPWPVLAVLPKWGAAPDLLHPTWVQRVGLRDVDADGWVGQGDKTIKLDHISGRAPHRLVWARSGRQLDTGPIDQMQLFSAMPGWTSMITEASTGGILLARLDKSNFYALSDPDLLNTQGLKDIANARAGLAVLDTLPAGKDPPVFFDVTLNGLGRTRSLIKLMVEPPFSAATLSVLAALALIGWASFHRFGAARRQVRPLALGKRALADNQAGLIRMARREHRMGGRYVQAVRELVARAVGAPRGLGEAQMDAFLDSLGRNRGAETEFSTLAEQAARARTGRDLAAVAERLYRWRAITTGERPS